MLLPWFVDAVWSGAWRRTFVLAWLSVYVYVGATVLVPVTWMVGGRLLAKRYGAARAAVLIAAGVGSGWVSIAWLGLLRELDEQPAV